MEGILFEKRQNQPVMILNNMKKPGAKNSFDTIIPFFSGESNHCQAAFALNTFTFNLAISHDFSYLHQISGVEVGKKSIFKITQLKFTQIWCFTIKTKL